MENTVLSQELGRAERARLADAARRRSRTSAGFMAAFLAGALVVAAGPSGDDDRTSSESLGSNGVATAAGPAADTPSVAEPSAGPGAAGPSTTAAGPAPVASVSAPSPGGPGVASAVPPRGATSGYQAAPAGGNGGATATGVTATAIKFGHFGLDSNQLGAACPRCGDKEAPKVGVLALVEALRRDKMLPIYGRDLDVVVRTFDLLSPEGSRNACVTFAQQDKPFVVVGQGFDTQCISKEFRMLAITGTSVGDSESLAQTAPFAYSAGASIDRLYRAFAQFSHRRGMFKGEVLGLYAGEGVQDILDKSLRAELKKLGYTLAVDMAFDTANSAASDAVAVQRMRSAGVTSVIVTGGSLTEPAGFQKQAEAQGYRPKYPIVEIGYETTDAVADVGYDANAQDGNFGMRSGAWEWEQRRPAKFLNNKTAQYCLDAYARYTGKTIDVYDSDAELRQLFGGCAAAEIARQAMINAGPNLTQTTFIQGLRKIQAMETSFTPSVSFPGTRYSGADKVIPVQFKKERWQPENNYWHQIGPWEPAGA